MDPGELLFGAATDPGEVSVALSDRYHVQAAPPIEARWTCLDTADWRLHRAGMTLRDSRRGRSSTLLLSDGAPAPFTAPSGSRAWPRRVDALPPSALRDRIAPAVGVRALLPLAEVAVRSVKLRLLDEQDKTRVRIEVDQQRLVGDRMAPLPLRVVVAPLRGYERDGERCSMLLATSMSALAETGGASAVAFAAAGHVPGNPTVPAVHLDPDAPAAESIANVLRRWIDVIDSVRAGVLDDVDIEYLHDMRISIRATRSLLRLSGGLVPDSYAARFVDEFAWLGRLTAPVRDLDVYLLELDGRGSTDLRGLDNLEPLRRHLAGQRRRALSTLRAGLESPRALALSAQWRAALDEIATADDTPPTRPVAAEQARVAYRRIVKTAAPVTFETHPEQLHRLRGRCKRMRYLLDAYGSIYVRGPHREVLAALKSLQDCLGEIQDVDVQRAQLSRLAGTLSRGDTSTETLLEIGAVRDRILRRDAAARRTLDRRLTRFCSPKTRRRVAALGSADA